MRTAGTMLIRNKEGLYLGVSRKNDKNSFGICGGKSEPGETPEHAAIRETWEETSVQVSRCVQIYERIVSSREGDTLGEPFSAYCFYALDWLGEPKSMEEGKVQWVTEEELTHPNSAFPDYNTEMFRIFKMFDGGIG
jgi:8-oxo-dGTP pyrophosphatase MutT (NUDIX family)